MRKILFLLLVTFVTNAFSQIRYEKGYFINNQNERSEILIKNEDWSLNPTQFSYKTSKDENVKIATIKNVKEFGVDNFSKYIRFTGKIDQSSDNLQIINDVKNPVWEEKTVFLKQLVEGKRNLYVYNDLIKRKFFFSDDATPIIQLIHKRYNVNSDLSNVYTNNEFRSQLAVSFDGEQNKNQLEKIPYKEQSLTKLFVKFNDVDSSKLVSDAAKSSVNFYIKPGISFATGSIGFQEGSNANVEFDNKISPRFGAEIEYVLPFRKNKFSIFFEPTYQSYNQIGENFVNNEAEIKYSVLEIPVGARFYMYINSNSKLFLEGVANIAEIKLGENNIRYAIPGTSAENTFDLKSKINFGVGLGYSYKNKFTLTARQYNNKSLSQLYQFINLDYKNFSLFAAYNIF